MLRCVFQGLCHSVCVFQRYSVSVLQCVYVCVCVCVHCKGLMSETGVSISHPWRRVNVRVVLWLYQHVVDKGVGGGRGA